VVEAMTALAYDFEVLGTPGLMDRVELGLGRIVALYYFSSNLYQIR
jgi:hypothetical protein